MASTDKFVQDTTRSAVIRAKRDIKLGKELAAAQNMETRAQDRIVKAKAAFEVNSKDYADKLGFLVRLLGKSEDELRAEFTATAEAELAAGKSDDDEATVVEAEPAESESTDETPAVEAEPVAEAIDESAQPAKSPRRGRFTRTESVDV